MKRLWIGMCVALLLSSCMVYTWMEESTPATKTLDIYFLDMMGGGSTLIVTPLGESILIDTGSLEPKHRDADRIFRATQIAGLQQIDHLVTTHFHSDHYGAILRLSEMIPIKNFCDHGTLPPEKDSKSFKQLYPLYQQVVKDRAVTIEAGDDIPLRRDPSGRTPLATLHCVASKKTVEGFSGNVDDPVDGQEIKDADTSDNGRSIALVLRYGDFDCFLGGDITWNVEHHLAYPENRVGEIDLYQVTHHGLDLSNNPVLLKALNPTVCVAMNGPRKGVQPRTFETIKNLSNCEALYQIHYNTQNGDVGNPPAEFVANKADPNAGRFIKASVDPSGKTYQIAIDVDGPKRTYRVK